MKGLFVLLVLSCIVAVSVADHTSFVTLPYPGAYVDSRFGGDAHICCVNNILYGTASGQIFFEDSRNSTGLEECTRETLQGNYWSTGPGQGGEAGTYRLDYDHQTGSYVGWFYPGGNTKRAWPWTLAKSTKSLDESFCLASAQPVTESINGRWSIAANGWVVHICANTPRNSNQRSFTEGSIFNGDEAVAYLRGNSYANNSVFIGRQFHIAGPTQSGQTCSDFGNALYRIVAQPDGSFLMQGFVTRGNLGTNPQIQFFSASQESTGAQEDTCDRADDLFKCEEGPFFPLLRSSASVVGSSLIGLLVLSFAALFF